MNRDEDVRWRKHLSHAMETVCLAWIVPDLMRLKFVKPMVLASLVWILPAAEGRGSVIMQFPPEDRDAAISWLASLELTDGGVAERRLFSTLDDQTAGPASLVGRFAVGADVGLLSVFGLGRPPSDLRLVFLDESGSLRTMLTIGYDDCSHEAGHFVYSGTYLTHPADWGTLGRTDRVFLRYFARNGSVQMEPLELQVPEPACLLLLAVGAAAGMRRRRPSRLS